MQEISKLKEIVAQFVGDSEEIDVKPLGAGHINDSYKVAQVAEESADKFAAKYEAIKPGELNNNLKFELLAAFSQSRISMRIIPR